MSFLPFSALVLIPLLLTCVGARQQVKCYQSNWNGANPPITGNNGADYKQYDKTKNGNQLDKHDSKVKAQHKIILRTCDPDVTHCLSLYVKLQLNTDNARVVKLHQVKCALSKKEKAAGFKDDYGVCDLAMEWLPNVNCTIEYDNRKETPDGGRMRNGKCDARDIPADVEKTGVQGTHFGCNVPVEVKEGKKRRRMGKRRRNRGQKRKQHQLQQQQADSEGNVMQGGDPSDAMSSLFSSLFAKRNRRSASFINGSVEQGDNFKGVNGLGDILEAPFVIDREEVRRGLRSLLISHFGQGTDEGSAEGSESGSIEHYRKRSQDATVSATPPGNEKTKGKAVESDDSNSKPNNDWIIIPIAEVVLGSIIVSVFVAVVFISRSKGRNARMRNKKRVRGSKESKKSGFDEEEGGQEGDSKRRKKKSDGDDDKGDDEEETDEGDGEEEVEEGKKGTVPEDDPDCLTWMKEKVTGRR